MAERRLADVGCRPCAGRWQALRPRSHRRVPRHEPPLIVNSAGLEARGQGPDFRRRRRAVYLLLPRGNRTRHSRFPGSILAARGDRHAGSGLPIDPAHPCSVQWRYRACQGALQKNLWTERLSSQKPQLETVRNEANQARYVVEQVLGNREQGMLLKHQAYFAHPRTARHSNFVPIVKFGGLKFLDTAM